MENFCTNRIADHVSLCRHSLLKLGILALVIGGSTVYKTVTDTDSLRQDLDGAVVVDNIYRVAELLGTHRPHLQNILRISEEENIQAAWPSSDDQLWHNLDAVRYSGFDAGGRKKSFKIISLKHFDGYRRHMNLLSLKDRRIYDGWTLDGRPTYRLQQGTILHSGFVVLHDPWLFEGACKTFAFGVTADLLLTGLWLTGEEAVGVRLRNTLLRHAEAQAHSRLNLVHFARSQRFDRTFRQWLRNLYGGQGHDFLIGEGFDEFTEGLHEPVILHGIVPEFQNIHDVTVRRKIRQIPPNSEIYGSRGRQSAPQLIRHVETLFASNSVCSLLEGTVRDQDGTEEHMVFLSKASDNERHDIERIRGLLAAQYYPLTQIPIFKNGQLLYPFFDGRSQADIQLQYRRSQSQETFEFLLDIEMRKSEDIFHAYQKSLRPAPADSRSTKDWPIHQFFHHRLDGHCRLRKFYGCGLILDDEWIEFDKLLQMPIEINGVGYPCLAAVHKQADDELHPMSLSTHPIVYSLGDAHGGNILVRLNDLKQQELLYIDYEASGFHSPLLDLAKPFYNDVFFDTLYADQLAHSHGMEVSLHSGKLCLKMTMTKRKLSHAILQIKKHFLIQLLFQLASQQGLSLDQKIPAFGSALFACALLTRNFANAREAFVRSLYHALVLSQVKTLQELFDTCELLLGYASDSV